MKRLAFFFLVCAAAAGAQANSAAKDIPPAYYTVTIPKDAPDSAASALAARQAPVNPLCPGSTTAPHCAIWTWSAPAHTDGSAITGTLTYDVSRALVTNGIAGAFTPLTTASISATTFEDDTPAGGNTYIYRVTAHENINGAVASTSDPATSAASLIPVSPLNPPGALTGAAH